MGVVIYSGLVIVMLSLNDREWHVYRAFGEEGLFQIKSTSSGVDGIRLKEGSDDSLPYITRTDANNGIGRFTASENETFGVDSGGCITIGLDTQTVFWQPSDFITGQNIHVVTADVLNENIAFFLIPIFKIQLEKFNWGGNGATLGRLKRSKIILPSDVNGEPDWEFMQAYVIERKERLIKRQLAFLEHEIEAMGGCIDFKEETEWQPFSIGELFHTFVNGKGRGLNHLKKVQYGGIEYIGATNRNDGVLCFVEVDSEAVKMIQPGNCIGFIRNGDGSAGYAIYREGEFISTSDVMYGYADWLNESTGRFFVVAQDKIKAKYSHGHKRSAERLKSDRVMLPVGTDGSPNWLYMEQYEKRLRVEKLKTSRRFLSGQLVIVG